MEAQIKTAARSLNTDAINIFVRLNLLYQLNL